MKTLWLVALGGAIGSVMRYLMVLECYHLGGRSFPIGTLVVNITGAFLIGCLLPILDTISAPRAHWSYALLVSGFLGGYTTFSAFSIETITLFNEGYIARGFLYIISSVGGGLIAAASGFWLTRQWL